MTVTPDEAVARPRRGAGVHDAIVDVASELFATHGIRAVSADRILADAGYSKVTFYRHFPTKDALVVAYLERELGRVKGVLDAALEESGSPGVEVIAAVLTEEMCRPQFRGCPFINAAAEYPEPEHPVRVVVDRFRSLMTDAIVAWAEGRGVRAPETVAHQIMMLRDGALVAGYLSGGPDAVASELAAAVETLLEAAGARPA